jgi:hypothetical protein
MTSDNQLEADLATIFAARDRDDMEPTVRALLAILEEHPEEASVLYAVAAHTTPPARKKQPSAITSMH